MHRISNFKLRKEHLILAIGVLINISFIFYKIDKLVLPGILWDEFGYWAVGAKFAGYDWSGLASVLCPYYSYGYGIILSILIRFISNINCVYQVSIIINSIFICTSIFISYSIFINVFNKIKKGYIALGCVLISFYSGNISNSKIAWSEIILYFIFWLSLFFLFKTISCNKFIYNILFVLSIFFLYAVHQRSIGILFSGLLIILIYNIRENNNIKKVLFLILITILLFYLHSKIKNYLYDVLWNNSSKIIDFSKYQITENTLKIANVTEANEYIGQSEKLKNLFQIEGIKKLLLSIIGKVYYMGISSFFLSIEGIFYVIKSLLKRSKKKVYFFLFLFFSFFTTLLISAIFMIEPVRIDSIIYGRYTDWIIGPLIIIGFLSILISEKVLVKVAIYSAIEGICGLWIYSEIEDRGLNKFYEVCSPTAYIFQKNISKENEWVLFMILFFILLIGLFLILLGKIHNDKIIIFIVSLMSSFWVIAGKAVVDYKIGLSQSGTVLEVSEILSEEKYNKYPVFFVCNLKGNDEGTYGWSNYYIGAIQFMLKEKTIYSLAYEEIDKIKDGIIIVPSYKFKTYFNSTDLNVLLETNKYTIVLQ